MELVDGIVYIVIAIVIAGTILFSRQGGIKTKSKKNSASEQLIGVHQGTIDRLQVELKKQVGRANRYQALYHDEEPDEEEESTEKGATFEEISELVKASYPQYARVLPLFKEQIMQATKGMSINEIIQYVGSITGKTPTGGLSQAATTQGPQDYRPDWA